MTMVGLPMTLFGVEEDDMSDNLLTLSRYTGNTVGSHESGTVSLRYTNTDTLKILGGIVNISDGEFEPLSVFDKLAPYQNLTGKDARFILVVASQSSGDKIINIYSSPSSSSIGSATLLFTIDNGDSTDFTGSGDRFTTNQLIVQNNHFIIIENVSPGSTMVSVTPTHGSVVIES